MNEYQSSSNGSPRGRAAGRPAGTVTRSGQVRGQSAGQASPTDPADVSSGPVHPNVLNRAALDNIQVDTLHHFTEDQKGMLVNWMSRGYTYRRIQFLSLSQGWAITPSIKVLIELRNDPASAELLTKVRDEEAATVMRFGLARKEERLRRLTDLAEAWEAALQLEELEHGEFPNLKASREFRAALEQIRTEVEPLGIHIPLTSEDPWALLQQELLRLTKTALAQSLANSDLRSTQDSPISLPAPAEKS